MRMTVYIFSSRERKYTYIIYGFVAYFKLFNKSSLDYLNVNKMIVLFWIFPTSCIATERYKTKEFLKQYVMVRSKALNPLDINR